MKLILKTYGPGPVQTAEKQNPSHASAEGFFF